MTSLRKLLLEIPKTCGHETYALLKALVEELEMQRPPEVDARITKLTAERDSWERQCRIAERGLAKVKAELQMLRKQRDEWAEKAVATAGESRLFVVPNQGFEADAEIGRLVRGMRDGTRLDRGYRYYASVDCGPPLTYASSVTTLDPAEALRAIQQKKE